MLKTKEPKFFTLGIDLKKVGGKLEDQDRNNPAAKKIKRPNPI